MRKSGPSSSRSASGNGSRSRTQCEAAQERLIEDPSIPYSIVHATQFFEFAKSIADGSTQSQEVHVPSVLIQPMAADEVANAVARVAAGEPIVEIAGPKQFRFDEFVRLGLAAANDPRKVVAFDPCQSPHEALG